MNKTLPFSSLQGLTKLMSEFIDENESVRDLAGDFFSLESVKKQIAQKSNFKHRTVLVEELKRQYEGIAVDEKVKANIQLLEDEKTFTITTGHQLCFATGPLYFPIKILQTIRLCEWLKEELPNYHFVPLFWMATEDHDYQEIQGANVFGEQHKMADDHSENAVGRLPKALAQPGLDSLKELLQKTERGTEAYAFLEKAWSECADLAGFTRNLTNQFFGKEGLVILDADSANLKQLFAPYVEQEFAEQVSYNGVFQTNHKIASDYHIQVNPREINLFYFDEKNGRTRLAKERDNIILVDQPQNDFNALEQLQQYPAKFSPNVILRPLYQEVILPNLAYIGGGGEISYWLQLRAMFNAFSVPFPLLIHRNSVVVCEGADEKKLSKLKLEVEDIFKSDHELAKKVAQIEQNTPPPNWKETYLSLQSYIDKMTDVVQAVDPTLVARVKALHKEQLKGIKDMDKELNKRLKKKSEDAIQQASALREKWLPGGGLHERKNNIFEYIAKYGFDFVEALKENIHPYQPQINVLNTSSLKK